MSIVYLSNELTGIQLSFIRDGYPFTYQDRGGSWTSMYTNWRPGLSQFHRQADGCGRISLWAYTYVSLITLAYSILR